ncbi:MAG: ABC transporter permease [Bombilactobacillus mellifer]|nr:ABC transporter permease [Bombilactobacillus mellifer]
MIKFEIKKLINNKAAIGGVIIAILILGGIISTFFIGSQLEGGSSSDPIHGRQAIMLNQKIAEQHTGPLTDDRIEKIIDFRAETQNKEYRKKHFMDVFSWAVADKFIPENYQDKFYGIEKVSRKGVEIMPVNQLGTVIPPSKLKLGNFAPWYQLFSLMSASIILISVLAIYLCSSVFSGDESKHLMPLLLTTKYGRTKLTKSKLLATFIISTTIFVIVQLITIGIFGKYFSFSGWDTSIQLNLFWNIFNFPINMNFMQLLFWTIAVQYLGLMFTILITCFISSYTKNSSTSLAVSLLFYFIPLLLTIVFRSGIISKLLNLFPIVNSNVQKFVTNLSNPGQLLFNNVEANIILTSSFMIFVAIVGSVVVYLHVKKEKNS